MSTSRFGLTFREKMQGSLAPEPADAGLANLGTVNVTARFRVVIRDLKVFLSDPMHRADLDGQADVTGLGEGLRIHNGSLCLFPGGEKVTRMVYRFQLCEEGGKIYHVLGEKLLYARRFWSLWPETTRLRLHLSTADKTDVPVALGGLSISVPALVSMTLSMRAIRSLEDESRVSILATLPVVSRFLVFFGGSLARLYLSRKHSA